MGRAGHVVGRALLLVGALVGSFTAYQLWGTGLSEARSQGRLRSELAHELPATAMRATRSAVAAVATPTSRHPRQTGAPSPVPAPGEATPPTGAPVGRIDIPSIGLDQVVVQGVAEAQLALGPGHYPGTPLPGEAGNVAIAGHRTTYRHPFYALTGVAPGAPIVITTPQGVFTYTAVSEQVVAPTDVGVLAPTAAAELTLTTCNPRYSAATRLVLRATLSRAELFGVATRAPSASPATRGQRRSRSVAVRRPPPAGRGLAGTSSAGNVVGALAWGAAATTLAIAAALAARHRRRLLGAGAALLAVGALFLFYGAVTPFLPPSI